MQSVHDDKVGGFHLLVGERYVFQIVFTLVGVVLCAVGNLCQRVLHGNGFEERVALFVGEHLVFSSRGHHGLVNALPVVNVLTLSPLALERLLTLAHGHRIIEIPGATLVAHGRLRLVLRRPVIVVTVAHGTLTGQLVLGFSLGLTVAFLFLFLLQRLDDTVDGLVALFLGQLGQHLQRVLQIDGIGVGNQFVEHLRTFGKLFIVFTVLVEQSDGLAVAALGIAEFLLCPIEVAQMEQQHALLDTAASGLLVAFLVGTDGVSGVALQQVDIAHGIIHLVEILRILIRTGHRLQPADHLLRVTSGHHLAHGDAGIELQLVRRIHAHHAAEGLVGIVALSKGCIQLTQQEVFTSLLLAAHLVLDGFLQVGNGFLEALRVDVVRGVGIVPLLHGTPVHRVALHLIDYVLGIVDPVLLNIAFGQPCTGFTVDGRLGVIEACHIGKGRGSLGELSAMELRASH